DRNVTGVQTCALPISSFDTPAATIGHTTGLVHVAGEVNTDAYADVAGIVRSLITGIGYDSSDTGFDGHSCGVSVSIGSQSTDIRSEERRGGKGWDSRK